MVVGSNPAAPTRNHAENRPSGRFFFIKRIACRTSDAKIGPWYCADRMRWFKGRNAPPERAEPDASVMDLLIDHGLAAYERQLVFGERVGDPAWSLDQGRGVLVLGDSLELPTQFLGSESERTNTWLWAWANPTVEPRLAERAESVRSIGHERGITALTDAQIDLDRVGGAHFLAMATTGALGANAYYRCPYEGGAAFVMIELPEDMRPSGDLSLRIVDYVAKAIADLPMLNSRRAIEGYLSDIGAAARDIPGGLRVIDGPTIRFDDLGRVEALDANVG